jgi:hypothetical protein
MLLLLQQVQHHLMQNFLVEVLELKQLVVLIFQLVVLVSQLVVLIFQLVVLVSQLVVLISQPVVLIFQLVVLVSQLVVLIFQLVVLVSQLVALIFQLVTILVLQHHLLNHQAIVMVNKEMLVSQVLNQLKVLVLVVFRHRMNQVPFQLKVVMLDSLEENSVVQVRRDMKVIAVQLVVLVVLVVLVGLIMVIMIRLLLHFMLLILIKMESLMLMNFVNSLPLTFSIGKKNNDIFRQKHHLI